MVLYVNSSVFPCLTFDLQRKIKKVHIIDFAFFTLNNSIDYDMPILAKRDVALLIKNDARG